MRRPPAALLPALAALLVHAGALRGGFHFDDQHAIVANRALADLGNLPRFFVDPSLFSSTGEGAMYRPLVLVVHAANAVQTRASGSALPWLATNLLLHAACATALFAFARAWLARSGARRPGSVALVAGLLYAVHPLASESVNFVSARSSSLSTLLVLAALRGHLWARERGPAALLLPLANAAAAMLARETAVVLPILVAFVELSLPGRARGRALRTLPFVALAAGFWALRSALLGGGTGPTTPLDVEPQAGWGRSLGTNVALQTLAAVRFLGLVVWPDGLTVDHAFPAAPALGHPEVVLAASVLAVVGALAFAVRRRPACAAGFAFVALGLAPYFVAPLNVVLAEHRLALPLAGASLVLGDLAASALAAAGRARLVGAGAVGAGLLALSARAAVRDADWRVERDDLPLWESALRVSPDSFRAHLGAGNALADRGDLEAAEAHYRAALSVYPTFDAARLALVAALVRRGSPAELDEAVALLEELLRRRPSHVLARFRLAWTLEARHLATGSPADAERCDALLQALAAENPKDGSASRFLAQFRRERASRD